VEMRISKKAESLSVFRIVRGNSGLTLIEVIVLMTILVIMIAVGYFIYHQSITKARLIMAENTLKSARENLENYYKLNKKYPDTINFTNCTDEDGDVVFYSSFCKQMKSNLYSIEHYTRDNKTGYELLALARDTDKTLLSLTAEGVNIVIVKQEKKNEF
jgi:Tfp pilus assembly protein PilE